MHLSIFLILISVISLALAYIAEHIFNILPCILCIYQRIVYFVILFLSIISIFCKGVMRLIMVGLCTISLFVGSAIAAYQLAIENGKLPADDNCQIEEEAVSTIEEMRRQIIGKAAVPCDKPQFIFLGLSMAGWNFFFSNIIGIYSFIIIRRTWLELKYE